MGRTMVQVKESDLKAAIDLVESAGPVENRSELYKKAADILAVDNPDVTPSVVYSRVKQFNIEVKTPMGKRGGGPVALRKPKGRANAAKVEVIYKRLLGEAPKKEQSRPAIQGLAKRAAKGNKAAKIKWHCLDCGGWDKQNVKHCQITTCAFHDIRPYQG